MGKKKKFGGEDTRGLKAKAQKAASRAAKDAERRSRAEQVRLARNDSLSLRARLIPHLRTG